MNIIVLNDFFSSLTDSLDSSGHDDSQRICFHIFIVDFYQRLIYSVSIFSFLTLNKGYTYTPTSQVQWVRLHPEKWRSGCAAPRRISPY